MPLEELTFRFRRNNPFIELSKKFPNVLFSVWDNFRREFMDVSCNDKETARKLDRELKGFIRKKGSKLLHRSEDRRGTRTLTMTCACDHDESSSTVIADGGCLLVPPITFLGGWARYRIVGFGKKDISSTLHQLERRGDVEVTSRRTLDIDAMGEFYLISLAELFSGMTKLQVEALVAAFEFGYYGIPRKSSTTKIASALKVPRTSFQERRKRAESNLMAALAPYALTYSKKMLIKLK